MHSIQHMLAFIASVFFELGNLNLATSIPPEVFNILSIISKKLRLELPCVDLMFLWLDNLYEVTSLASLDWQ
jgi:hypothetical protein